MNDEFIKFALVLLAGGIATIITRVWKIPQIEAKLDNVIAETDKNRDRIHDINNTLHSHDLRISALEKTKQETH
jgi:hypothetical protein